MDTKVLPESRALTADVSMRLNFTWRWQTWTNTNLKLNSLNFAHRLADIDQDKTFKIHFSQRQ